MLIPSFLVICGFVMLGAGAEFMVSGSSRMAMRVGISPLIVGLTIVAFGTSAPELAVSLKATTEGFSSLALGNVIGSNIANVGLVLGLTALICPIRIEKDVVKKQIPIVIISSALMGVLLIDGQLDLSDGLFLTMGLLGFLILSYRQADTEFSHEELDLHPSRTARERTYFSQHHVNYCRTGASSFWQSGIR